MFCPRCGQQQVSEETRFCSRCGFLLSTVSHILANNGEVPFHLLTANKARYFTRRNGLIFTVLWFLIFVLILTPICAILLDGTFLEDTVIPIVPIIGIFGSLVLLILSFLLPSSRAARQNNPNLSVPNYSAPNQISGNLNNQTALPPQAASFTPVNDVSFNRHPQPVYAPPTHQNWRSAKTGELLQPPPSVTEDTTKILNETK